uniref:tRNA pseudouridine synthase n=1 Tax=Spongospora subterranea TaxID=70186 RepID=A0A0H5QU47_9EUKA|eukprot:CRZ05091.1 hypothetical protein [Spongospora subterranea]
MALFFREMLGRVLSNLKPGSSTPMIKGTVLPIIQDAGLPVVQDAPRHKQNLAMVVAYVGSNYRGIQKQPEQTGIPTIERELEQCLYKIGCIRESNFGHLDKIGWSRSSRTDAGVHSTGTICSAKLLLNDLAISTLPVDMNKLLPSDIRVLAVSAVPKSWRARFKNAQRVYEYLVPLHCLPDGQHDWRKAMRDMIGPANVHNFSNTRTARDSLTPLPFTLTDQELSRLDRAQIDSLTFQRDPTLNRVIENVSVSKFSIDRSDFWRFRIQGTSFAYNQIRLMVGVILAVGANVIPLAVVKPMIKGPAVVRAPLAPAGGLLLTYSQGTFPDWKHGNGVDYLPASIQALCDKYKNEVIYREINRSTFVSEFTSWLDETKNDERLQEQDFDTIVKRFDEWLPIYKNPELHALKRRQTLLAKWLPETRPFPPNN